MATYVRKILYNINYIVKNFGSCKPQMKLDKQANMWLKLALYIGVILDI